MPATATTLPSHVRRARENRPRKAVKELGFVLRKSRARTPDTLGYAQYWKTEDSHVVAGAPLDGYGLTPEKVAAWVWSR